MKKKYEERKVEQMPVEYSESKMGEKLRKQGAEKVRNHDRNKNDNTGRVHYEGPGK